ncbi:MAG: hypothetical protein ABI795_02760 [Chthoniobacterales bacterium]
MPLRLVSFVTVFLCGISTSKLHADPLPRSISTSRQFIVYGTDAPLRGAVCDLAERTKSKLLSTVRIRDEWKLPIVVNAQYPQANAPELPAASLTFSQTGFGLKIQLDLIIPLDVNAAAVQRELLRATLLEIMYRERTNLPPGSAYMQPPPWLLEGIIADEAADPAQLAEPLRTLAVPEGFMSLEKFVRQNPDLLEPISRGVYAAYAHVLLEILIDSPDGRSRLARFVRVLPDASNDPFVDLRAAFPALGVEPEKVWRSAIAQALGTQRFHLLSASETEQQLNDILHLRIGDRGQAEKNYQLHEFPQFIHAKTARAALRRLSLDLLLLATRANPLVRPIVLEYQRLSALLSRGKTHGVKARIDRVNSTRAALAGRQQRIDDYLNWFEATQSLTSSGAFTDYLRAAGRATEPSTRHDPISLYMNSMEVEFGVER